MAMSPPKTSVFVLSDRGQEFFDRIHREQRPVAVPFEISTHPKYLPACLAANKRCLCHGMFDPHIRTLPTRSDLENLNTLTGDTKANIQFGPDVRRRSAFLNESIDNLFDSLPFDIVQRHSVAI